MPIAARHRDDPIPALPAMEGLVVRRETSAAAMAEVQRRSTDDIARRFVLGHRAYLALVHGAPAAWGWVASRAAEVGELGTDVHLAHGERYLWDFVTRPEHRGRGIYPRLLEAIVRAESREASRFWIACAPENHASVAGIRKAGFVALAELAFDQAGQPALASLLPGGAAMASRILSLTRGSTPLAPCWRCVRTVRGANWSCRDGECRCDYQVTASGCAA